jgi:hypothetical protein
MLMVREGESQVGDGRILTVTRVWCGFGNGESRHSGDVTSRESGFPLPPPPVEIFRGGLLTLECLFIFTTTRLQEEDLVQEKASPLFPGYFDSTWGAKAARRGPAGGCKRVQCVLSKAEHPAR